MPVLDQLSRLALDQIVISRERRQRREIKTEDLEASIRLRGVVTPIICQRQADGSALLIAGERRLEACRRLGLPDIPLRWTEDLDERELQIIELEENIKRQDLTWKEQTLATARIHQLYLDLDPGWTMTETATQIGITHGTLSVHLRVARCLGTGDERLEESSTVREAWNLLARREAREHGAALEELLGMPEPIGAELPAPAIVTASGEVIYEALPTAPPKPVAPVELGDFLAWAPAYSGPRFNLIHCDFPYGIGVFSGPQAQGQAEHLYDDSSETYFALIEALCRNLPRLMSLSGHLMFWTSAEILSSDSEYSTKTFRLFRELAPSLEFHRFPLVWVKSDGSGIASDPRRGPRHVYETCLFASRGARQIVKIVSDVYACPIDRSLHPSTKPEPMLRHFFSMLVDHTTSILDPTAGSGAALRAADSLGAPRVVGLEIDSEHVRAANQAFRNARLFRTANKLLV